MRDNFKKVLGVTLLVILALGGIAALLQWHQAGTIQQQLAETRRELRAQGFKTDLADFNLGIAGDVRARANMVASAGSDPLEAPPGPIDLLPVMPDGSAAVVWKPDWLNREDRLDIWTNVLAKLAADRAQLDAASDAIFSGPLQFDLDASRGRAMLLPHLAPLRSLSENLGLRTLAELHEHHPDAAWTNLLALTRLVNAWNVEPAEVSHLVHFGLVNTAFNATWQSLHREEPWPDEQLAALQHEWESADVFTNLPETAAFQRASYVALCQQQDLSPRSGRVPAPVMLQEYLRAPSQALAALKEAWNAARYRSYGMYADQRQLLLIYRDRETDLRTAVAAPTWLQMRGLPGATNAPEFKSPYRSRIASMIHLAAMNLWRAYDGSNSSLLGRAASVEARRRLAVTALALERFRQKHGGYPQSLTELSPEFLPRAPVDFMDGQPLRYRLAAHGNFILYSVGLDCMDDGGRLPPPTTGFARWPFPNTSSAGMDIVWPLPASAAAIEEMRRQEERAEEAQSYRALQVESAEDWTQSPERQQRVDQLLATKWAPALGNEFFAGHSAAEFLQNPAGDSQQRSLAELLTPHQVLTGGEPEDLTFEFPVKYELFEAHGISLLVDADIDRKASFSPDSGAKCQEKTRAPNGNCRLTWHTIYDPPGRHAVQVEVTWNTPAGADTWCRGPAIPVTTSNLCQFSLDSSVYNVDLGARFHARLPEDKAAYAIDCLTTNGVLLATLSGTTSNGEFDVVWNLLDKKGRRLEGETFNSLIHLTFPESERTQTLRGP